MDMISAMVTPLTNDPVAATTQAFNDNALAAFADIDRAGSSTRKSANNRTTQGVALIVDFAKHSSGAGT
jgi:hypothetical protein